MDKVTTFARNHIVEIVVFLGAFLPGLVFAKTYPRSAATLFVLAGLAFAVAYLLGKGDRGQHHLTIITGLLLPGVLGAGLLKQLAAPENFQQCYAWLWICIAFLGIGVSQGWFELPEALGALIQRAMALPWLILLATSLNSGVDFAVKKLWLESTDVGFTLFLVLGILPMFFLYFSVVPAKLVDQKNVTWQRWCIRYVIMLVSSLLSTLLLGGTL